MAQILGNEGACPPTITRGTECTAARAVRRAGSTPCRQVVAWAEDLWRVYGPQHPTVRGWLDELTRR